MRVPSIEDRLRITRSTHDRVQRGRGLLGSLFSKGAQFLASKLKEHGHAVLSDALAAGADAIGSGKSLEEAVTAGAQTALRKSSNLRRMFGLPETAAAAPAAAAQAAAEAAPAASMNTQAAMSRTAPVAREEMTAAAPRMRQPTASSQKTMRVAKKRI